MSKSDYFDNEVMRMYIAEADRAVDAYLAARGRKDLDGMEKALRSIHSEEIPQKMRGRKRKIDKGVGGDTIPRALQRKKPPAAVRIEEDGA